MRKITRIALAVGTLGILVIGAAPSRAHDFSYYGSYDDTYEDAYARYYADRSDYRPYHRYYYSYRYYDPYYRYSNEYDKRLRRANNPYFFRYYYKGYTSTEYSAYNRGFDVR